MVQLNRAKKNIKPCELDLDRVTILLILHPFPMNLKYPFMALAYQYFYIRNEC